MPRFPSTDPSPLGAQRSLTRALTSARVAGEHIASGERLAQALDGAAALAIADLAHREAVAATQAIRNANDGLSAARIAGAAMGQIGDIQGRLAELATQSASGTLSDAQRGALQDEFGALVAEIDRIAATTSFNGQFLLQGGGSVDVQVGTDGSADARVTFGLPDASAAALGLGGASIATQADAQAGLDTIAASADALARQRGTVGAIEGRLQTSMAGLRVATLETLAAESRIRDADVAVEVANLVRAEILGKAGVAVLSQANQQARVVLGLLR
jgi:flagellin